MPIIMQTHTTKLFKRHRFNLSVNIGIPFEKNIIVKPSFCD